MHILYDLDVCPWETCKELIRCKDQFQFSPSSTPGISLDSSTAAAAAAAVQLEKRYKLPLMLYSACTSPESGAGAAWCIFSNVCKGRNATVPRRIAWRFSARQSHTICESVSGSSVRSIPRVPRTKSYSPPYLALPLAFSSPLLCMRGVC